jgi:hypothetical protein
VGHCRPAGSEPVVDGGELPQDVGRGVQGGGVVVGECGVERLGQGVLALVVAAAAGVGEGDQDGPLVAGGAFAGDVAGCGEAVDQLGGAGAGGLGGSGQLADRQRARA